MKKYVTPYLFTLTFIFGLYFLVSLIMVGMSYFLPLSSSTYRIILLMSSYTIIIAGSYLFIHFIPSKPLIHAIVLALFYLMLSYLTCNGVTRILHLLVKPMVFIVGCIVFSMFKKEDS